MEVCTVVEGNRFLKVTEVAGLLQIGRSKAYALTVEWERTGGRSGIPFVWCGNQKRVPYHALMRWVDGQLEPPAA